MKRPLALYLHIPFCASKCAYCDFASYPGREGDWARYFHALWEEMRAWENSEDPGTPGRRLMERYEIVSLFIGGGTPSLVSGDYLNFKPELVLR